MNEPRGARLNFRQRTDRVWGPWEWGRSRVKIAFEKQWLRFSKFSENFKATSLRSSMSTKCPEETATKHRLSKWFRATE